MDMESNTSGSKASSKRQLPSIRNSASFLASDSLMNSAKASEKLKEGKEGECDEEANSEGEVRIPMEADKEVALKKEGSMSVLQRISSLNARDVGGTYARYTFERFRALSRLKGYSSSLASGDLSSTSGATEKEVIQSLESSLRDLPAYEPQVKDSWFRYYLILTLILWIIVTLPFWVPFVATNSTVVLAFFVALYAHQVAVWIFMSIRSWMYMDKIEQTMGHSWDCGSGLVLDATQEKQMDANSRDENACDDHSMHHIVVLPIYQEPLDVVEMTMRSLAEQTLHSRIIIVVGMEDRTPAPESIEEALNSTFRGCFHNIYYCVHPSGLPNEVPGKCSNENWALRWLLEILFCGKVPTFSEAQDATFQSGDVLNPKMITVTSCDADTVFPLRYFEYLELDRLRVRVPHNCIWQAPIFYNWGSPPFYVRVTGLFRPFMQMGLIIPFQIQNNGIYSCMLELCLLKLEQGCGFFFDPSYQMEDVHFMVDCQIATRGNVDLRAIPLPLIAGPTCGTTTWMQLQEWAKQAQRWTVGAAETFHYIVVGGLLTGRIPLPTLFWYMVRFLHLHLIVLNASGIVVLLGATFAPWFLELSGKSGYDPDWLLPTLLGLTGASYVSLLAMFMVDRRVRKLLRSTHVELWRNFLHLLLSPLVVLGYNLVSFWAIQVLTIKGKRVCIHIPAFKGNLAEREVDDRDLPIQDGH